MEVNVHFRECEITLSADDDEEADAIRLWLKEESSEIDEPVQCKTE